MKVLAVSDSPVLALHEPFDAERWRRMGVELILACGDLSSDYLDFLLDIFSVPLYYVRGNHDNQWSARPGGEDIDGQVVEYGGVRFLGIGGSPWYNGGELQYTERAMAWKMATLRPKLWLARRIDVVVAHAAPQFCPYAYRLCPKPVGVGLVCPYLKGGDPAAPRICHDASDHPHRGFESFRQFILRYQPRLFIHGHRHQTYGLGKRELRIGDTRVVDAYGRVLLDL